VAGIGLPLFMGMASAKLPTCAINQSRQQTLLYKFVKAHYAALVEHLAQQVQSLPNHVHREFDAYLKCRRRENGFLRVRYDKCH
jgi:hypothetical protein